MLAKRIALLPPLILLCLLGVHCSHRALDRAFIPSVLAERAARLNFVDLHRFDSSIVIDLRYATSNNVVRAPIYPRNMPCLLFRPTAVRLAAAQRELREQGLGLKIWDGYRPPRSHLALWEASPKTGYVASPNDGFSRHCMGIAVDVTLVDSRGREMPMPTGFDHFSTAASANYSGSDPAIRENVRKLQTAMRNAGFSRIESEWWHFEDRASPGAEVIFARDLGIQLPPNVPRVRFSAETAETAKTSESGQPASRGRASRLAASR